MSRSNIASLLAIIVLAALAAYVDWPTQPVRLWADRYLPASPGVRIHALAADVQGG